MSSALVSFQPPVARARAAGARQPLAGVPVLEIRGIEVDRLARAPTASVDARRPRPRVVDGLDAHLPGAVAVDHPHEPLAFARGAREQGHQPGAAHGHGELPASRRCPRRRRPRRARSRRPPCCRARRRARRPPPRRSRGTRRPTRPKRSRPRRAPPRSSPTCRTGAPVRPAASASSTVADADLHAAFEQRRHVRVEGLFAQRVAGQGDPVALAQPGVVRQGPDVRDAVVPEIQSGQVGELRERRQVGDPVRRGVEDLEPRRRLQPAKARDAATELTRRDRRRATCQFRCSSSTCSKAPAWASATKPRKVGSGERRFGQRA